jgi:hypothetical protein
MEIRFPAWKFQQQIKIFIFFTKKSRFWAQNIRLISMELPVDLFEFRLISQKRFPALPLFPARIGFLAKGGCPK